MNDYVDVHIALSGVCGFTIVTGVKVVDADHALLPKDPMAVTVLRISMLFVFSQRTTFTTPWISVSISSVFVRSVAIEFKHFKRHVSSLSLARTIAIDMAFIVVRRTLLVRMLLSMPTKH